MTYEVKKLYRGLASVRDYVVRKCLSNGEPLVIIYGDKRMTIPCNRLKSMWSIHEKMFFKRFKGMGGDEYGLVDFTFIDDKEAKKREMAEVNQLKLFG